MNSHILAAIAGALACATLLALVLWEVRQHALAKKGVGEPCKHGKPKRSCVHCRPRLGLFSFFSGGAIDPEEPADDKSSPERKDAPKDDDSEGDSHPQSDGR